MGLFSKPKGLPFNGAFFNLNGTVVDTEKLHEQAWWKVLARRRKRFQDYNDEWHAGRVGRDYFKGMMQFFNIKEPLEIFAEEWEREASALVLTHAKLCPGVEKVLKDLRKHDIHLVLLSESSRQLTESLLLKFDILTQFKFVISREWLYQFRYRGKPAPDPYFAGANAIGLHPNACIAFDNTVQGVASAKLAGIRSIIGTVNYPSIGEDKIKRKHSVLRSAGALMTFKSLKVFTVAGYAPTL